MHVGVLTPGWDCNDCNDCNLLPFYCFPDSGVLGRLAGRLTLSCVEMCTQRNTQYRVGKG